MLKRLELLGAFLVRREGWFEFFEIVGGGGATPTPTPPSVGVSDTVNDENDMDVDVDGVNDRGMVNEGNERGGRRKGGLGLEGFLLTQSPRFDRDCLTALVRWNMDLVELRLDECEKMEDGWLVPEAEVGARKGLRVKAREMGGESDSGSSSEGDSESESEREEEEDDDDESTPETELKTNPTSPSTPPPSTAPVTTTTTTYTISHLTSLTSLSLSLASPSPTHSHSLSSQSVIALLSHIGANLKLINLSGNEGLTNDVLIDGLGKFCKRLRVVKLCGLVRVDDLGVAKMFSDWSAMGSCDSSVASADPSDGSKTNANASSLLVPISDPINPITTLDLSRNPLLSNYALTAILSFFSPPSPSSSNVDRPPLRHLNINSWKDLSSEKLMELASSDIITGSRGGSGGLETLDVSWSREVDGFFMKDVVERTRGGGLKWVKCYGCNKLGSDCPKRVSLET